MKTFSILTIFFCFFCFNKFEIIEATSQKWHGGTRGSGYGTYYKITIIPKTNSNKLKFDKIWVGEKYFNISTFQKGKKMKNNLFEKGDTITIQINDRTVPKNFPHTEKDKCLIEKHELPHKYEGKALLSYTYKGKRKYKEITNFIKKTTLNYP